MRKKYKKNVMRSLLREMTEIWEMRCFERFLERKDHILYKDQKFNEIIINSFPKNLISN